MNKADETEPDDTLSGQSPTPLQKSLSQTAGNLLERMLGPAADELGTYLGDQIRAWRFRQKNIEEIAEKTSEEIKRRGLDNNRLKSLPQGDVYRAMDACSLEDDETVQQLWAGLFASAMDPDKSISASKVFVDILRSLGPAETGLLLVLHQIETRRPEPEDKTAKGYAAARKLLLESVRTLADRVWRRRSSSEREKAVQNLMRLRCIGFRTGKRYSERALLRWHADREAPARADVTAKALDYLESLSLAVSGTGKGSPATIPKMEQEKIPEVIFELTSLGRSLMDACNVESTNRDAPS